MDIQIILIAIVILIMAWALERIVAKTQNLEKHIAGLRTRLNNLEKRLTSAAVQPGQTVQNYYTATAKPSVATRPAKASSRKKKKFSADSDSDKNTVVCPFCGTEFDINLDRCPNCHHINIEKYKIRRKDSSAESDDFDL